MVRFTPWKVSKYGVFSSPYFPIFGLYTEIYGVSFSPNTEKYGPEKNPYLDTFHAVISSRQKTASVVSVEMNTSLNPVLLN